MHFYNGNQSNKTLITCFLESTLQAPTESFCSLGLIRQPTRIMCPTKCGDRAQRRVKLQDARDLRCQQIAVFVNSVVIDVGHENGRRQNITAEMIGQVHIFNVTTGVVLGNKPRNRSVGECVV